MKLLMKLAEVGKVTQIHFKFFANCSRNAVIQEDASACLFSGVSLYLFTAAKSLEVALLVLSVEL